MLGGVSCARRSARSADVPASSPCDRLRNVLRKRLRVSCSTGTPASLLWVPFAATGTTVCYGRCRLRSAAPGCLGDAGYEHGRRGHTGALGCHSRAPKRFHKRRPIALAAKADIAAGRGAGCRARRAWPTSRTCAASSDSLGGRRLGASARPSGLAAVPADAGADSGCRGRMLASGSRAR